MLISVIIPVYNTAKFIKRCVDSVIGQLTDNVELIFIDDSSTDNSLEVLYNMLSGHNNQNIHVLENKINLGSGETRNKGIAYANGEYVIFIDSDDYVSHNYFENLIEATAKHPDIIVFDYSEVTNNGIIKKHINVPNTSLKCVEELLLNKMHNSLCNKLFKKSLFTLQNVNIPKGMSMFEDKSICFKLFYYAKTISYIEHNLYFYDRTRVNSLTNNHRDGDIDASVEVVKTIDDFFRGKVIPESLNKAILANKMHVLGFVGLYRTPKEAFKYTDKFGKLPLSAFINEAKVPLHYKLSAFFANFRMAFFLYVIRKLYFYCK